MINRKHLNNFIIDLNLETEKLDKKLNNRFSGQSINFYKKSIFDYLKNSLEHMLKNWYLYQFDIVEEKEQLYIVNHDSKECVVINRIDDNKQVIQIIEESLHFKRFKLIAII